MTECCKHLVGSDGQGFALTVGLYEPCDTGNANLIAAAPDLLTTCRDVAREMRAHIDSLRSSTGCPDLTPKQCAWAERLEAAVAKAEGR